ncbi:hypothetical protein V2J09_024247 [Rumex salicifolius]
MYGGGDIVAVDGKAVALESVCVVVVEDRHLNGGEGIVYVDENTQKLVAKFVARECVAWELKDICIWIYLWIDDTSLVQDIGQIFIADYLSCFCAFLLNQKEGEKSFVRSDLLQQPVSHAFLSDAVWWVTLSTFDSDASLDVLDHPILDLIYYMLVEILPSALVLFILRKLPPKRVSAQYHPIR